MGYTASVMRCRGVVILLLSVLISAAFSKVLADTQDMPGNWQLELRAPLAIWYEPQDAGYARDLSNLLEEKLPDFAQKLGTPIPDSIRVVVAPNRGRFRYLTRGLPDWTGGAAYPRQRSIILKSPTMYTEKGQFNVTALHELVHILTDYRGPSRLPRWLSEGVAMVLSGETMYKNRTPLGRAVVTGHTYTLEDIERMLRFGPEQARVAYLQSISFVKFLVDRYGWDSIAQLIEGYRTGVSPDTIFQQLSGHDFYTVEVAWHQQLRHQYRWYRLFDWLDFTMLLWVGATFLVIIGGGLAIIRRRKYLSDMDEENFAPWQANLHEDEEPPDGDWYVDKDEVWR